MSGVRIWWATWPQETLVDLARACQAVQQIIELAGQGVQFIRHRIDGQPAAQAIDVQGRHPGAEVPDRSQCPAGQAIAGQYTQQDRDGRAEAKPEGQRFERRVHRRRRGGGHDPERRRPRGPCRDPDPVSVRSGDLPPVGRPGEDLPAQGGAEARVPARAEAPAQGIEDPEGQIACRPFVQHTSDRLGIGRFGCLALFIRHRVGHGLGLADQSGVEAAVRLRPQNGVQPEVQREQGQQEDEGERRRQPGAKSANLHRRLDGVPPSCTPRPGWYG